MGAKISSSIFCNIFIKLSNKISDKKNKMVKLLDAKTIMALQSN
jgi:hypothetical protein